MLSTTTYCGPQETLHCPSVLQPVAMTEPSASRASGDRDHRVPLGHVALLVPAVAGVPTEGGRRSGLTRHLRDSMPR